MEDKKIAECQEIPLAMTEKEVDRHAMFSKHRSGLYKKASKLVQECDADVGIVLFPPSGNPFSFFHPTSDAIIDRFMNPTVESSQIAQPADSHARKNVYQSYDRLKELHIREKAANRLNLSLDQVNETRQIGWWESIDKFSADDVIKFEAFINSFKFMLKYRLKKLENEASSSVLFPQEDADNSPSTS